MGILDFFKAPPSRARFPAIAVGALRAAGFDGPIQVDPAQFRLLLGEQGERIFHLENFYGEYCRADKAGREHIAHAYANSVMAPDLPSDFAAAAPRLLPILRSRFMNEYLALAGTAESSAEMLPAAVPFSADTVLLLAHDNTYSLTPISGAALAAWGVSFATAQAAALDNLRDRTIASFSEVVAGVYLGNWDDDYDSSRLLFSDVLHQAGVSGTPVAMIPTRGRLLVASANDSAALLAMIDLAREVGAREGRHVSALMYWYEGGQARAYRPLDPAVAAALGDLQRHILHADYGSQQSLLDQLHEQQGIDVFVASFKIFARDDSGAETSFTVWTEDVDTLLPQADVVVLVSTAELEEGRAGPPTIVGWDDLQAATGAFEQLPGRYPPRYKPGKFPDQQLRATLPASEP